MKTIQRQWVGCAIFFLVTGVCLQGNSQSFNRKDFYAVMASANLKNVDGQINLLKNWGVAGKQAFEGALLMKKAGLVKVPAKKLSLFKQGHKKLEAAIDDDKDNGEYRFLRLMIQENAPGILGYKKDLDKDSAYLRQSFKKLPTDVQQAITDYSKTSKALRTEDF